MDTQHLMQLRQSDEELEREFIAFCQRTLIGLPKDEGMKRAQELLRDLQRVPYREGDEREEVLSCALKCSAGFAVPRKEAAPGSVSTRSVSPLRFPATAVSSPAWRNGGSISCHHRAGRSPIFFFNRGVIIKYFSATMKSGPWSKSATCPSFPETRRHMRLNNAT